MYVCMYVCMYVRVCDRVFCGGLWLMPCFGALRNSGVLKDVGGLAW